jgi:hypothetical protein
VSPSISLVVALPDHRPPRLRVLEAIFTARAQGTPLAFEEEIGVRPALVAGRWCVDRSRGIRAINIIGALLLQWQTEPMQDEDPVATVARELRVPLAWAEGVQDGWNGDPSTYWLGQTETAKHYRSGLDVGYEARLHASLVCPACNARRMKGEERCPGCDR